jgi:hypothetical protein
MGLFVLAAKGCDEIKMSCQCFAEMLINFRSGEFLELQHDFF